MCNCTSEVRAFARPGMTASYPLFLNPAEIPLIVI